MLTLQQVCDRIGALHLDELDLRITRDGDGFAIEQDHGGPYVGDIGSSYETPPDVVADGRHPFIAGPFAAYAYDPDCAKPLPANYLLQLRELATGRVSAVIIGVTSIIEDDGDPGFWVLGVRTEN